MKRHNDNRSWPAPAALFNLMWLRCKLAWAQWMERRFGGMGRKRQYIVLYVFATISLMVCFWLIFGGLVNVTQRLDWQPVPIKKVVTATSGGRVPVPQDTVTLSRIQRFHSYMDSLSQSSKGRTKRDSILKARPGLLDSIYLAEKIINNRN